MKTWDSKQCIHLAITFWLLLTSVLHNRSTWKDRAMGVTVIARLIASVPACFFLIRYLLAEISNAVIITCLQDVVEVKAWI